MKIVYPGSRHIVCASNLPGADQPHYNKSYCDDGEPGAGKKILDLLVQSEIENRVIFVTRKYGGVKMGSDRFECYLHAAKSVITAFPYNEILQQEQKIPSEQRNSFKRPPGTAKSPGSPKQDRISVTPPLHRKDSHSSHSVRGARGQNTKFNSRQRGAYQPNIYQPRQQQQRQYQRQSRYHDYRGYQSDKL